MSNALHNLSVKDTGQGNTLACDTPNLAGNIQINGSNNHISVAKISLPGRLDVVIEGSGCHLTIGKMRRFGNIRIILKEGGSLDIADSSTVEQRYFLAVGAGISIGRDCMISSNVSIRTTDAHGIYDRKTGALLNPPASVKLDDHVWLGQASTLLKGTSIGRNSVIAAGSILSKKTYPDHAIIGGIPAKVIQTDIIWDRRMTENAYAEGADVDGLFASHQSD